MLKSSLLWSSSFPRKSLYFVSRKSRLFRKFNFYVTFCLVAGVSPPYPLESSQSAENPPGIADIGPWGGGACRPRHVGELLGQVGGHDEVQDDRDDRDKGRPHVADNNVFLSTNISCYEALVLAKALVPKSTVQYNKFNLGITNIHVT